MDASNLVKPMLASGELRCIGSTTFQEYRGIFEKDRALARRFQKIDIVEPTVGEAVEILQGLKARYEAHHGVRYADDASSEERRVGNECVRTGRSRWSPTHTKKKNNKQHKYTN